MPSLICGLCYYVCTSKAKQLPIKKMATTSSFVLVMSYPSHLLPHVKFLIVVLGCKNTKSFTVTKTANKNFVAKIAGNHIFKGLVFKILHPPR